ncbi:MULTISPECIES: CoxG family protein [unclassified Roseovarius]|uniref:CoxG family protein n=1 Tax=unclassified Roseovarius TaxID=2614913 RepID=UPI00273EADE5|nr:MULTISPECIES: carbon monoxide dehydrogenase subunit G [unclassified Roseovarius]
MEIKGKERIVAPREAVWRGLNDPDILRACIPGCQSLEKSGEDEMAAIVKIKIGVISATFKGEVRLENKDEPNGYTIIGAGTGGVAGFAKGKADIRLSEEGGATVLDYVCTADVGGKIAQLGARLIESTVRRLSGQFFSKFTELASPHMSEQ